MYINPEVWSLCLFLLSLLPFGAALIIYRKMVIKSREGEKSGLMYLVLPALLFFSAYLLAYIDTISPVTKVWIIRESDKTLIKKEMISLFKSAYVFENNNRG